MLRVAALLTCLLLIGTEALAHDQRPPEHRMGKLIQQAREVRGLGATHHGTRLHRWGRRQTERMIACGCVKHAEPPPYCRRWGQAVGVGLGVGSLFRAFMASPAHRRILLDPDFTRIGIGARRSAGLVYVAIEFC